MQQQPIKPQHPLPSKWLPRSFIDLHLPTKWIGSSLKHLTKDYYTIIIQKLLFFYQQIKFSEYLLVDIITFINQIQEKLCKTEYIQLMKQLLIYLRHQLLLKDPIIYYCTIKVIDYLVRFCGYYPQVMINNSKILLKTLMITAIRQSMMSNRRNQKASVVAFDCIQAWAEAFPKDVIYTEEVTVNTGGKRMVGSPLIDPKDIIAIENISSPQGYVSPVQSSPMSDEKHHGSPICQIHTNITTRKPKSNRKDKLSPVPNNKTQAKYAVKAYRLKSNFALIYQQLKTEKKIKFQRKENDPIRLPILTMNSIISDQGKEITTPRHQDQPIFSPTNSKTSLHSTPVMKSTPTPEKDRLLIQKQIEQLESMATISLQYQNSCERLMQEHKSLLASTSRDSQQGGGYLQCDEGLKSSLDRDDLRSESVRSNLLEEFEIDVDDELTIMMVKSRGSDSVDKTSATITPLPEIESESKVDKFAADAGKKSGECKEEKLDYIPSYQLHENVNFHSLRDEDDNSTIALNISTLTEEHLENLPTLRLINNNPNNRDSLGSNAPSAFTSLRMDSDRSAFSPISIRSSNVSSIFCALEDRSSCRLMIDPTKEDDPELVDILKEMEIHNDESMIEALLFLENADDNFCVSIASQQPMNTSNNQYQQRNPSSIQEEIRKEMISEITRDQQNQSITKAQHEIYDSSDRSMTDEDDTLSYRKAPHNTWRLAASTQNTSKMVKLSSSSSSSLAVTTTSSSIDENQLNFLSPQRKTFHEKLQSFEQLTSSAKESSSRKNTHASKGVEADKNVEIKFYGNQRVVIRKN